VTCCNGFTYPPNSGDRRPARPVPNDHLWR